MKIKIFGNGARIGYTRLSDDEFDWLFDELGSNPLDQDLKEFCSDENIWTEIRFKHDINGPYVGETKLFLGDKEYTIGKVNNAIKELPKLSFVPGDSALMTLVKDYRGTWFVGEIPGDTIDVKKLRFDVISFHDFDVIEKVYYGNKEIANTVLPPLVSNSHNTYVSLQL